MAIGVLASNLGNSRIGEVVVVVVRYYHSVYVWDMFNLTRQLRVSFWTQPGEWGAAIGEDRIEEDSETTGKLDIVTRMA